MGFGIPIKLCLFCWSRGIKLAHVMQVLRDTIMKFNIAAHARNFIFVASKQAHSEIIFCISRHKTSVSFVSPIICSNRSRPTIVKVYLYFFPPRNCLYNFLLPDIALTFNGVSFLRYCTSYPADDCVLPEEKLYKG
jgi:hypothetical protein